VCEHEENSSASGCVIIKFVCSSFPRFDEKNQQLKYDKNNWYFKFKSKYSYDKISINNFGHEFF
jgi:hypothetical protein